VAAADADGVLAAEGVAAAGGLRRRDPGGGGWGVLLPERTRRGRRRAVDLGPWLFCIGFAGGEREGRGGWWATVGKRMGGFETRAAVRVGVAVSRRRIPTAGRAGFSALRCVRREG
jgi:hypothetical protein